MCSPWLQRQQVCPRSLSNARGLRGQRHGNSAGARAAALVKSGTTTLQTALALVPMVVTYQMHPLTYQLAQRLVEVPHIALANLVAGERVVPELVQDQASPRALAAALLPLLADTSEREHVVAGLRRVREQLARADHGESTAERVAALAAELIERPA
jgi:lipid-A-disaccharide synthase